MTDHDIEKIPKKLIYITNELLKFNKNFQPPEQPWGQTYLVVVFVQGSLSVLDYYLPVKIFNNFAEAQAYIYSRACFVHMPNNRLFIRMIYSLDRLVALAWLTSKRRAQFPAAKAATQTIQNFPNTATAMNTIIKAVESHRQKVGI